MTVASIPAIKSKENFYRNLYRKNLSFIVILLALLFIITIICAYDFLTRSAPRFYAASSNGNVIEVRPLGINN